MASGSCCLSVNKKNLGPIWKVICCSDMGVEMPAAAVEKILVEQRDWMKDRSERTGVDFHRKRKYTHTRDSLYTSQCYHRNKQKAAKNMRHEAEKLHMAQRQGVGIAVGQYQGGGQKENAVPEPEVEPQPVEPVDPVRVHGCGQQQRG